MKRARVVAPALAAVVAALALGCASTSTNWVGRDVEEMIRTFGPPTKVIAEQQGIRVFIWQYERRFPEPQWAGPPGSPHVEVAYSVQICQRLAMVDSSGQVVAFQVRD